MNDEELNAVADRKYFIKRELNQYYTRKFVHGKSVSLVEQYEAMLKFINNDLEVYDYNPKEFDQFIKDSINEMIYSKDNPSSVFEYDYKPWLMQARDKIKWFYNDRYIDYLLKEKDWSLKSVKSINETTDIILDHCGNPLVNIDFNVKGLVIGDIQSGKTANYTSLINKALDVGYKLIIILAGLTNDLRSQTQKRLDKEVLGYETKPNNQRGDAIGVGKISKTKNYINCLTQSNVDGDLKKMIQTYPLGEGCAPIMVVVKKNSSVLKSLINFIASNPVVKDTDDLKLHTPTLIIDDEADQASINTAKNIELEEATRTNQLIRKLINICARCTYIGYTATPFANIFIPTMYDEKYQDSVKDLFPSNFIICLPTPEKYCGVKEYFGIDRIDDGDNDDLKLDLFREIYVEDIKIAFGTSDGKTKKDTNAIGIPDSLKEAIMHFIIASGVKISRGIIEHNSMLVHMTKNVCPNEDLKELIDKELDRQTKGFKFYTKIQQEFKKYWEYNIKPTSQKRMGDAFNDTWPKVKEGIIAALRMVTREDTVKLITGDSEDIIDYSSSSSGMHIIVGGDKLSRGLTLDGLIVSYYYRNAQAFDTLLQMGRWFGYRDGWLDLCRVYTTREIIDDFIAAAEALDAFKMDIDTMNNLDYTPTQFGLKVLHNSHLMPTAANKRRSAELTKITFSGDLQQTISFSNYDKNHNRELTCNFLNELNNCVESDRKLVYRHVPAKVVLEYLKNYKECLVRGRGRISVLHWINYIEKLNGYNELVDWTVVLHSLKDASNKYGERSDDINGHTIIKPTRKSRSRTNDGDTFLVKAITNPNDFLDFFDKDDPIRNKFNSYKAGDAQIRERFTPQNALLTIYDFDIVANEDIISNTVPGTIIRKTGNVLENGEGFIGLGIWFPVSPNEENTDVSYFINEVYQKTNQEQRDASLWRGED